ncbi:MAG: hypothetical protein ACHP7E_11480 [Burkholderiales bacterium]
MNRISAIALALVLGCAGSVYAASAQDGSATNSGATTHQVGSDIKGALHKMGAATRGMLHRAEAALHRVSHPAGKSTSQS